MNDIIIIHANNSKNPKNSHLDRHEIIDKGYISINDLKFFIKEMELSKRAKEKGEERESQMDEIFEREYKKIKGYLNIDEIISNDLNPTIKPFFFHVPKTLEAWKEELKKAKTEPVEGIHYKIDKGIVFANAAYVIGKKGVEKLEEDLWEILEKKY